MVIMLINNHIILGHSQKILNMHICGKLRGVLKRKLNMERLVLTEIVLQQYMGIFRLRGDSCLHFVALYFEGQFRIIACNIGGKHPDGMAPCRNNIQDTILLKLPVDA